MASTPEQSEIIRDAINDRLNEVFTSTIGRVEKYDKERQTIDVSCVVQHQENIGGETDFVDHPVIPNVPVAFPRAGGFYITFPIAVGDHVLLVFTHDSIADWRESGGVSQPSDLRRHQLGSCVAIPGVAPEASPLSKNPLDAATRESGLSMGADGGDAQLFWDAGAIVAGRPGPAKRVVPVALADRTESRLEALEGQLVALTASVNALNGTVAGATAAAANHVHGYASPGGPAMTDKALEPPSPPGPPTPPFVPVPLPVAADILKGTGPAT